MLIEKLDNPDMACLSCEDSDQPETRVANPLPDIARLCPLHENIAAEMAQLSPPEIEEALVSLGTNLANVRLRNAQIVKAARPRPSGSSSTEALKQKIERELRRAERGLQVNEFRRPNI